MNLRSRLSWLSQRLGLRKMEPSKPVRNYSEYAVILINPIYEPVTRHMRNWLSGLNIPSGVGQLTTISGPLANRGEVDKALRATAHFKRIKVFCGHGVADALLGPPQPNETIIQVGECEHSAIYDGQFTKTLHSSLFAFCCNSGAELGKRFCSYRDHTFLGYLAELPIETENEQCLDVLKNIFQTISSEIIQAGQVLPQHERRLRSMYHEAYLFFFQGEGRHNKRARYMWLALNEHRRLVCRYGGKP